MTRLRAVTDWLGITHAGPKQALAFVAVVIGVAATLVLDALT